MTQQLSLVSDNPKPGDPPHLNAYSPEELSTLAAAGAILRRRLNATGPLESPEETREYIATRIATLQNEAFGVMYLDNRHRVVACEEIAHGTINKVALYPRAVVQNILRHNCAAVIFYHNHPSGIPEPSRADERITEQLVNALKVFDIRVLDHFIVSPGETAVSFAERGLL